MPAKPSVAPSHSLVVDDVLVSSWGYEQTNVSYYQVISLVGKSSVMLRAIAKDSVETEPMIGKCTPMPNVFLGSPFKKRVVQDKSVKLSSFCVASRKEYQLVDGKKIFNFDRWTAYA